MTKLPFTLTHDGVSLQCFLHVDAHKHGRLIELRDPVPAASPPRGVRAKAAEKIEFINDLLAADMPWDALASCRRSLGMFGSILDPACAALDALRASLSGSGDAV